MSLCQIHYFTCVRLLLIPMPLSSKKAWLDVQKDDQVHVRLKLLIEKGHMPPQKKTGGDHNKLKLLHNLFKKGELKIDKDGLILVRIVTKGEARWVTSIPSKIFPGLSSALHLRFAHPSKGQQISLMQRYFYCPGYREIIAQTVDNCSQCMAMKILPKVMEHQEASPVGTFGKNFACDVLQRHTQKFLVTVESVSGFTLMDEVQDQTAEVLRTKMLSHVSDHTTVPRGQDHDQDRRRPSFQNFVKRKSGLDIKSKLKLVELLTEIRILRRRTK